MKLNNFVLIFIFLIIGMNVVCAGAIFGNCWNTITCSGDVIDNGTIINTDYTKEDTIKEEMCEIDGINIEKLRFFEIEIIQGQFEGGVKPIKIFVNQDFIDNKDKIYFLLNKATSPTYVLCHEVIASSGTTENPIRIGTRRYWVASYDQQWFKQNAGMPEYSDYENLKNWNENKTYNNPDENVLNTSQKGTQATNFRFVKF